MKRDLDLVRTLLLALEEISRPKSTLPQPNTFRLIRFHDGPIKIDGYTEEEIAYHLELIEEAGFLTGKNVPYASHLQGIVFERLSWEGCDFLDTVRDNTVWGKTKEIAGKAGAWSFDSVKKIAVDIASSMISTLVKEMMHP